MFSLRAANSIAIQSVIAILLGAGVFFTGFIAGIVASDAASATVEDEDDLLAGATLLVALGGCLVACVAAAFI